jgi:hypothetical protein
MFKFSPQPLKWSLYCTVLQLRLLDSGQTDRQAVFNFSVGKILGTSDLDLMISIYLAMQRPVQQMKAFMEVWCDLVFWLKEKRRRPSFASSCVCDI